MAHDEFETPGDDEFVAAVEAILFAAGEPVPAREIASALGAADAARIDGALEVLRERYGRSGSGLRLESVAGGFRLTSRSEVGAWVRRFFRQRNRTRLSQAALETLAIVAYRQPVTAPEIQAIRGVDPSAALKNLVEKRMIRILGRKKVVGNPLLYGTSRQFLVHFGLNRLEDLPSIEDFEQFLGRLEGVETALFASEPAGADELLDEAEHNEPEPGEPPRETP
jgi:segregation and condensation protein B